MKPTFDLTLYLVTDSGLNTAASLPDAVEQAIMGGVTLVQLREKTADSRDFYEKALQVKAVTDRYSVPLIINDRLDIAQAVNAAGVHLGAEDIPVDVARKILGDDKIIGATAKTLAQALAAEKAGADYLGCGAMYLSTAKPGALPMSKETLSEILAAVHIPVVAIGGIGEGNVQEIIPLGVNGVAVVSAIIAQDDITAAAARLRRLIEESNISG